MKSTFLTKKCTEINADVKQKKAKIFLLWNLESVGNLRMISNEKGETGRE